MTREDIDRISSDYLNDCESTSEMEEIFALAIEALEQEPCEDAISRETARRIVDSGRTRQQMIDMILATPSVKPTQRWIPVSERLPEDLEPVNITWVNHSPISYYADIKDKPFTATGVYFNGKWYWWSALCTDILAEYGYNHGDVINDCIEIIAWMPLPQPYKAESDDIPWYLKIFDQDILNEYQKRIRDATPEERQSVQDYIDSISQEVPYDDKGSSIHSEVYKGND